MKPARRFALRIAVVAIVTLVANLALAVLDRPLAIGLLVALAVAAAAAFLMVTRANGAQD